MIRSMSSWLRAKLVTPCKQASKGVIAVVSFCLCVLSFSKSAPPSRVTSMSFEFGQVIKLSVFYMWWITASVHPREGWIHSLVLACAPFCKCLCVCVQRFVSQDFLPPEYQHLVLTGARLRPGLMVKLPPWPLTYRLTTNHDNGVEWSCPCWPGAAVPSLMFKDRLKGNANWPLVSSLRQLDCGAFITHQKKQGRVCSVTRITHVTSRRCCKHRRALLSLLLPTAVLCQMGWVWLE